MITRIRLTWTIWRKSLKKNSCVILDWWLQARTSNICLTARSYIPRIAYHLDQTSFIKKERIPQLMKIMNAPSLWSLLSNMEMNMIFDMAPCNSFKNRKSTSVCANCMFNLENTRSNHFQGDQTFSKLSYRFPYLRKIDTWSHFL